jgi:hypothetical protein
LCTETSEDWICAGGIENPAGEQGEASRVERCTDGAGNAHPRLALDIASHLQLPLGQALVSRFKAWNGK